MFIHLSKIFLITMIVLLASCTSRPTVFISQENAKYNTPFINASETSQLDFGLSKDQVLDILGEPLYVSKGEGSTKKIIWVYEVRAVKVKYEENPYYGNEAFVHIDNKFITSLINVEDVEVLEKEVADKIEEYLELPKNSISSSNVKIGKDIVKIKITDLNPAKWSSIQKHTEPIHQLALEFINDKLENWHQHAPESEDSNENSESNDKDGLHIIFKIFHNKSK